MSSTINLKKKKRRWTREIVVICAAIALTTVAIKASDTLINGDDQGKIANGACPEGMVSVAAATGDFCIDKYEASAGSQCPNSNPGNQEDSRDNISLTNCKPVSVSGALPWRYLSQNQAAEACAKAGKRLPTNKEWLLAALGTPDKDKNWLPEDCNVADNWGASPGAAGSGENCVSAAGAYDMIGNVWEWVDGTTYDGEFEGRKLPEAGYITGVDDAGIPSDTAPTEGDPNYYFDYLWVKTKDVRGMARGGYWDNKGEAGQYSLYVVTPPAYTGIGIGFRCVK